MKEGEPDTMRRLGGKAASPICSLARVPDGAVMESNRTNDN